ncbi:EDD domain protein, DegV family [Caloramator fervidus]|uniref:EDD domain protein, DegV family n=1 Tax=Caloramator fervidus TaxID=29344 RepID=A0A1H5SIX8_9CLOT|nr:DegV family protein [Caloramator fervidus]SEF50390.1 EDD domain protein, DegV family [Caloramator fervidus]
MRDIVIVTDSTADIPKSIVEENNIVIVPLTVTYRGKTYKDGVDLSTEELVKFLNESDELPKTSQVNPNEFYNVYKKLLDEGKEIISIHLSSGISGTYQSALIAKQMLNTNKIYVIDGKAVSFGTGLLVLEALKMIKDNRPAQEIAQTLEELSKKVKVAFLVDDIEYIKKGGRLSGAQAVIAKLLNIKPIIHMQDGKLYVYDKVRGLKKAIERIFEYLEEMDVDVEKPIGVGTISYIEEVEDLCIKIKEKYNTQQINKFIAGTVVATYSGPGVIGVVFFSK